jgi:5-methylcytosine-specific restriction enzyme A
MAWSKESRHARGYGAAWDKLRKTILERDTGICQPCKKAGRIHVATEVDHVVSKAKARAMGWTQAQIDHPSNLQAINSDCHKAKTAADEGRTIKPKTKVGLDGFPITG